MGKRKSLIRQVSERLSEMRAFGESKFAAKSENGGKPPVDKIYSHSTMDNYRKSAVAFAKWARDGHGCRTLDEAKRFVPSYLQERIAADKSAWTVHAEAAALSKLYQCSVNDWGVALPSRHRGDVTQHRTSASVGHFSEARNADLVALCKATGLRRHEVRQLRPEDVRQLPDGRTVVHVRQGKGGKSRTVTALNDAPARIARRAEAEGRRELVRIPKYAPIHEYRADFANEMYRRIARPVDALTREEKYICRKDKAGRAYDREAMKAISLALGHSRVDVVTNYLR